jgi:hypothetical protein
MNDLDKAKEKAEAAARYLNKVQRAGLDDRKAQSDWAAAELEVLKAKRAAK